MLLTTKELNKILRNWRISIPDELKKELINEYGSLFADDDGHAHEHTEQDICEQLRKRLRRYENFNEEVPNLT